MEIKVKPEQLEQIAKNISEMQTHSQNIQQNLNQSMFSIQMQWQGAASQHFYGEYMRSMRLMESYIRNLQVTEKELRRIAQKFRQADEEYQKKQNEKLKETHKKEKKHEKSWWEKGIEGAAEFIGVNDAIRAVTGKDPITGKELSTKERLIAAGWTLLNFVPVGKVASLAGKGIKYVASSFGKTIVKAGKRLGEGITMVAGKAGKAAVDGIKTATHKVKEGVNFVASTAKSFADKIGSLWNKGATTVKTTFLQGNQQIQHAVKILLEYKWIPGLGKAYVMPGVGMVREMGQHSLKDAYQYMKSVGEKGVKGTGKGSKGVSESNLKNIDEFINGSKNFDDVINDYAKVYKEHVESNRPWSWDDNIPGGDSLSSSQRRKIKEMAISKGHIPKITVNKVEGMRYGFADFASANLVKETVHLPEEFWKLSDKHQFKWLDEQIGGTQKGMTWHHTEVPGKMELVPFGIHNITPHNGGRTKGMWADAPR
ncbi:WXG100 family type VII secretion target [Bacillus mycoides]|nr:WXG100 family type VII secretion target [Bacillus mycoides]SCC23412.1 WXG100 family type VII secretion target [Bacillus mycoides]